MYIYPNFFQILQFYENVFQNDIYRCTCSTTNFWFYAGYRMLHYTTGKYYILVESY